jgi:hypothetical protein
MKVKQNDQEYNRYVEAQLFQKLPARLSRWRLYLSAWAGDLQRMYDAVSL